MTGTAAPFESVPVATTTTTPEPSAATSPSTTPTTSSAPSLPGPSSSVGSSTSLVAGERTSPAAPGPSSTLRPPTSSVATTASATTVSATTVAATTPTLPATTVTTAPPRTIGACQAVGLDVANAWRAELGRAPLAWSSTLYAGACAWATHLAELGGGGAHQAGPYGEVVYGNSNGCSGMWTSWRNSSAHYNGITGESFTTGAFVTVTDSNGRCWAVGRMAL